MSKTREYYSGSTRLTNSITLQKWKDNGLFQKVIDEGYTYNAGCGRFRMQKCECYKCRKSKKRAVKDDSGAVADAIKALEESK